MNYAMDNHCRACDVAMFAYLFDFLTVPNFVVHVIPTTKKKDSCQIIIIMIIKQKHLINS